MNYCNKCGFTGEDELFVKKGHQCKSCAREYASVYRKKLIDDKVIKTCVKCGFIGDYEMFRTLSNVCKNCVKNYNMEHQENVRNDDTLRIKRNESSRKRHKKYIENPINKEKINKRSKMWQEKNRVRYILSKIKNRSNTKGYEFNITVDDIIIPELCPVLGTPLTFGGNPHNSPSIDRIDPSKGYIKGNVIVVSGKANAMKNCGTKDDIIKLYKFYVEDNNFNF